MDTKIIEKLVKMQKDFSSMYSKTGLIGVSKLGVHLSIKSFRPFLGSAPCVVVNDREDGIYQVEFTIIIKGVKFFALADFSEVQDLGLGSFMYGSLRDKYMEYLDAIANDQADSNPANLNEFYAETEPGGL